MKTCVSASVSITNHAMLIGAGIVYSKCCKEELVILRQTHFVAKPYGFLEQLDRIVPYAVSSRDSKSVDIFRPNLILSARYGTAQAVRRWRLITEVKVLSEVRSCGIDTEALGKLFSGHKRFSHTNSRSTNLSTISSQRKKHPWPQSASELYRPDDRRLSAKLVTTFADRGCNVVSVTDPHGLILGFLDWSSQRKRTVK
jgi:hypothetical protein